MNDALSMSVIQSLADRLEQRYDFIQGYRPMLSDVTIQAGAVGEIHDDIHAPFSLIDLMHQVWIERPVDGREAAPAQLGQDGIASQGLHLLLCHPGSFRMNETPYLNDLP